MHAPLGYHLAVEMCQLLQKPDILQKLRAAGACGHNILVVCYRCSGIVGEFLFVSHGKLLFLVFMIRCFDCLRYYKGG